MPNRYTHVVVPEHLKKELNKVDWENIETAMGGGKKLPVAINGLLTEDEDVVATCLNDIWFEIEHQGSIYEAAYKVATVIAHVLPHYTGMPVVRARLLKFLFEVLGSQYILYNRKLYNYLVVALNAMLPLILEWANDKDELTALRAQFILIHAVKTDMLPAEALFIREWQDAENIILRKVYAICSLGVLYLMGNQKGKLVSRFSAAFLTATEPLERLMLACYLVNASQKEAKAPWLAELTAALNDPDSVDVEFYELNPFTSGYEVEEYVLMILEDAKNR